jgi:hypothetical protein
VPGEPWAPGLADVARHVPTRTRDTKTPGSDAMLGTFTASTTPTAGQAQQVIDDTVAAILADVGELPATPEQAPEIAVAARVAAEWRAAADIEVAFPNRDADVRVYDQLNARAEVALATLKRVLAQAGAGVVDVSPEWSMPDAPPWGDTSPGSGTDALLKGGWRSWLR